MFWIFFQNYNRCETYHWHEISTNEIKNKTQECICGSGYWTISWKIQIIYCFKLYLFVFIMFWNKYSFWSNIYIFRFQFFQISLVFDMLLSRFAFICFLFVVTIIILLVIVMTQQNWFMKLTWKWWSSQLEMI